jgi:hypothetical protein
MGGLLVRPRYASTWSAGVTPALFFKAGEI